MHVVSGIMQTQGFEFRVLQKKFEATGSTSASQTELKTSPRLQRKLNKLRKSVAHKTAIGKLFQQYSDSPIGVKGKSLDDNNNLRRQKAKYISNFSCSQSSLTGALGLLQPPDNSARTVHSKGTLDSSARSINSYLEYSGPRPSLASEKSLFMPGYDDDFFDLLDLPGHFNTRGVYGQKANPAQLSLSRSKSDLHLNYIRSLHKPPDREKTFMSMSSTKHKVDFPFKQFHKPFQLPKIVEPKNMTHNKETDNYKENCDTSPRIRNCEYKKADVQISKTAARLSVDENKDRGSNPATLKVKRLSVDATTQTDFDYDEAVDEEPVFAISADVSTIKQQ